MRNSKILWRVLKRTRADKLVYCYLILLVIISFAIWIIEPNINSFVDSLWYCFSVLTTIGFGDIIAVTLVGRILSIILSVYSILIIAVIPGVITSFYVESIRIRSKESMEKFMYDLEHLSELSNEELVEVSEKVKKFNRKNL